MQHKFLFEERAWKTKGTYVDEKGRKNSVTGVTSIKHGFGKWEISGEMIVPLKGDKSLELRNIYRVKPMKPGQTETTWSCENKIVGKFTGRFFIANDTIVSTYATKDGKYRGFETFKWVGGVRYENEGQDFFEDKKISSWSLILS